MGKRRNSAIVIEGDVARVELTQGRWALIDAADVPLVEGMAWHADNHLSGICYAASRRDGKRVSMHRLILRPRPGFLTDHRDGDGLNNRRGNLREATHKQNMRNRKTSRTGLPKGVFYAAEGLFAARLHIDGSLVEVGRYPSIEEAQAAYNAKGAEVFGEFFRPDLRAGFREDPKVVARYTRHLMLLRTPYDLTQTLRYCSKAEWCDLDEDEQDQCSDCLTLEPSPSRTRREVFLFRQEFDRVVRERSAAWDALYGDHDR